MKNLYEGHAKTEVMARVSELRHDNKRRLGTMQVAQMMPHCSGQLSIALGEVPIMLMYHEPIRWLAKNLFGKTLLFAKNLPTVLEMRIRINASLRPNVPV